MTRYVNEVVSHVGMNGHRFSCHINQFEHKLQQPKSYCWQKNTRTTGTNCSSCNCILSFSYFSLQRGDSPRTMVQVSTTTSCSELVNYI